MTEQRMKRLLYETTKALLNYAPKNHTWFSWLRKNVSITNEELTEINSFFNEQDKKTSKLKMYENILSEKDGNYNWQLIQRNNVIDIYYGGIRERLCIICNDDKYKLYTQNGKFVFVKETLNDAIKEVFSLYRVIPREAVL